MFSERFGTLSSRDLPNGGGRDETADVEKSGQGLTDESRPDVLEQAYYRSIRVAAAILRYFGKVVACINAVWLLVSNLMVYAGGDDSCFCQSNYISLGPGAWVLLFKVANDLQQTALTPWAAGITASIIVCIIAYMFFWLGSADTSAGD